jgi:hypothetical protein
VSAVIATESTLVESTIVVSVPEAVFAVPDGVQLVIVAIATNAKAIAKIVFLICSCFFMLVIKNIILNFLSEFP